MTANENSTKQMKVFYPLETNRIVPVYDELSRRIGSAVARIVEGGVDMTIELDKSTPEAFDVEIDPNRIEMSIEGTMVGDELAMGLYLITK